MSLTLDDCCSIESTIPSGRTSPELSKLSLETIIEDDEFAVRSVAGLSKLVEYSRRGSALSKRKNSKRINLSLTSAFKIKY